MMKQCYEECTEKVNTISDEENRMNESRKVRKHYNKMGE